MKGIVRWFAENHVAANLVMFLLLVGGISTMFAIPQKTFPDIDVDMVSIGVEYLGAAPEEVEEGVCIRIEEQVDGIEGIDKVRSTATEGACAVFVEMLQGADAEQVLDDVRNRVDAIDTFPAEVEKPVIAQVTMRRPVVDVAISGRADERSLKELGERVRDEILALPGITQASLAFTRPYEVSIEVPEESLRRYGLTFDQVVEAVRRSSLDLPGGSIKTSAGEILLRTKGQAYSGQEFEKIVVLSRNDGTRVTLADVGRVVDGFEDVDLIAKFDGEPTVMVQVFRVGDQDVIELSDAVKHYIADAQPRMPEGIQLSLWQDESQVLRGRLDTMFRNGRSGLLLVFVVLALFLRFRLAFWVSLGVPVAFMGALWTLPFSDVSIDVISLFAFIVVLGILVDDAIVVAENIHTHQEREPDRLKAAISGAQEVSVPVVFGVLTTVAAFSPLLTVPGPMGQVFSVMATVVIACLIFSVVESQLVLPAHLAHGSAKSKPRSRVGFFAWWRTHVAVRWRSFQDIFSRGMAYVANHTYARFLDRALEWRLLTVSSGVAALMLTLGVIAGGHMHFSFFPPIEADYLAARLTMPQGTPVEATNAAAQQLVDAAAELRKKLDPEYAGSNISLVKYVLASVGSQPFLERQSQGPASGGAAGGATSGSHVAEVVLELVPSEQRAISTSDVGKHWRNLTGSIPDAVELVFASDLFSVGEAVNVQLEGTDIDDLREAAERIKLELSGYPGVIDIADSFRSGKQEIKLSILPTAEPLGLTMRDLARQVRQAFYGEEAQRIQRGRDDVRVMVRYPELQRRSLGDLEGARIRTPDGTEVPFSTVARADLGRGFAAIRRTDRKRVVNVTADVDRNLTTANDVIANLRRDVLPRILGDFPSVSYGLEGAQREQSRALSGLARSYLIALMAIYALLAIPLRSYSQPLIIMSVIPFGLVGAIGGHLLLGKGLSFMSVIGIVALSGVVVNDSLVLVHNLNQRRASGVALAEAVRQAGVSRFRPIVLTSLTTFVGLTPLMLERSVQAQFLIPMAISLSFGSLFATVITLVIVPSAYLLLDDLTRLLRRGGGAETQASVAIGSRSTA